MNFLRFGIRSLDQIINNNGHDDPGGISILGNQSTSISIIGPDGTGKSILGLHLASHYLYDQRIFSPPPIVLYVSTDLSHVMAKERTWEPFALDYPGRRTVPFRDSESSDVVSEPQTKVALVQLRPLGYDISKGCGDNVDVAELEVPVGNARHGDATARTLSAFLNRDPEQCKALQAGFVDLAANTAGDDWGFINRVLAHLPPLDQNSPAHLIILDAVEGFETLVGDLDAYGQISTRRNRIAQLMRSAHDRCHLVFIAEEPSEERRLPEQFVTDVVLRLRKRNVGDYIRRTLEVEKARGLEHVRGMHPYVIRSGRGSSTGSVKNLDDPEILRPVPPKNGQDPCQSYFHVFSSLHHYSRGVMQKGGNARPKKPEKAYAAFGIHYLDSMLDGDVTKEVIFANGYETSGLPCASVTALIGDSLTQKTRLGLAFLSRSFAQYRGRLNSIVEAAQMNPAQLGEFLERLTIESKAIPAVTERILRRRGDLRGTEPGRWNAAAEILCETRANSLDGAAILLTTHDIDRDMLVNEFRARLLRGFRPSGLDDRFETVIAEYCRSRTICRRLEIHDLPSPIFLHIVQRAVREAQSIVLERQPISKDTDERFNRSHRIRIVIDDLSAVLATYTELRNDPLFLPALLFYLRREGVTSLIVDTHSGQPGEMQTDSIANEIRTLVDQRLYTWHVPFFGENRVAIAPIPPLKVATVRELKAPSPDAEYGEDLDVDPEFEMYTGFEERRPQPVPLEVHVYDETPAFRLYMEKENLFHQSLFAPNTNRERSTRDIIVSRTSRDYESLQDFCYLDNHVRLDHTLVFEVDEFWATRKNNALADLGPYLRETTTEDHTSSAAGDPFELFQPTRAAETMETTASFCRFRSFPQYFRQIPPPEGHVDRVPFCWDFGFLTCRNRAWDLAANGNEMVRGVWENLRKVNDPKRPGEGTGRRRDEKHQPIRWYRFLEACRLVARAEGARTATVVPAFDLSLLSPESFSCLVLEVWASEFSEPNVLSGIEERAWNGETLKIGLIELLDEPEMDRKRELWRSGVAVTFETQWLALFKTWLMLGETLDLSNLADPSSSFEFVKRDPSPLSVATRHWYKTASAENTFSPSDPTVITQLPGSYSVRGDWFLAVSRNSRSMRLAHRAIDILSSRRSNINRLRIGLGLPVRDIKPMDSLQPLETIKPNEMYDGPRTCVFKPGEKGERHTVSYADLIYVGADSAESPINWLWRSRLKGYDRHARVFHQWLCRMMIRLQQIKFMLGPAWIDGFKVIEELESNTGSGSPLFVRNASATLEEFVKRLRFLITDLKQASLWEQTPPRTEERQ